jgi:hypothetical protein
MLLLSQKKRWPEIVKSGGESVGRLSGSPFRTLLTLLTA